MYNLRLLTIFWKACRLQKGRKKTADRNPTMREYFTISSPLSLLMNKGKKMSGMSFTEADMARNKADKKFFECIRK